MSQLVPGKIGCVAFAFYVAFANSAYSERFIKDIHRFAKVKIFLPGGPQTSCCLSEIGAAGALSMMSCAGKVKQSRVLLLKVLEIHPCNVCHA